MIYSYAPNSFELYHLGEDLSERNNLAQAEPERVRILAARMLEIIEESGGQWPVLKEDGGEDPLSVARAFSLRAISRQTKRNSNPAFVYQPIANHRVK